MILRQTVAIPAVAALALAALVGCSSSNAGASASATNSAAGGSSATGSNAGLSDSALRAAFKTAVTGATAMHVTGSLAQQGQTISLDLALNKDDTSQGSIALGNAQMPIKAVGGVVYIQLSPSFIQFIATQQKVSATTLAPFANKWISSKSASGKSLADGFAQFLTFSAVATNFDNNSGSDPATAAGTKTLNGQSVAYYTTKKGSKLYFAASGPAYLLREDDSGTDGTSTLTITWNQPTTVTAPPASDLVTLPGS